MPGNKTIWGLAVAVLVPVCIYWIWFTQWGIYTWGDWGFVFTQAAREFVSLPQVWASSGLGGIDISLPLFPFVRLLPGILSHFFPWHVASHLIYLLPSVILPAVGSFALTRYIYKSNLAGIIGSFVLNFNTYFLIIRGGHLPLLNSFSLAPLALVVYLHALRTSSLRLFVLTGLIGSLSIAFEIRGAYILYAILLGLTTFYAGDVSKHVLAKSMSTYVVTALLSAYWLLGLFSSGGTADLSILQRHLYGQGYAHIVRSAAIQTYQWSPSGLVGPGIQPTPPYYWLIPLLAFWELYLSRKNKLVIFFGIVSLVGIFFSKMAGQPFPGVYQWMFEHFPGFSIFREPSKFFFVTALGYSVLLSGLVKRVWTVFSKSPTQKFIRTTFVCLVSGMFLLNARQVVTGKLGELLQPRSIPADYMRLKDFISKQPEHFRTFYLPYMSRWGFWLESKPLANGLQLVQSSWYDLNAYQKTGLEYSYFDEVSSIFTKAFSDKLFDMTSIKYVVVPVQDDQNNDDLFALYGPREKYLEFINKISFLKQIDIGTEELGLYENLGYLPRVYLSPELDSVHQPDTSASPVSFIRASASEYRLELRSTRESVYVNFSDLFHPGWRIARGRVSWVDVVLGKQEFLDQSDHVKNSAGLNSFRVTNPQPGIYTVYFTPQAYLNLGLMISMASGSGVLFYLFRSYAKRHD